MYPLDDDNLDRLSREAAEHFEVQAGASGWDRLEQRLDKELPQEKKRRRFLFWLILLTATTGGALTGILKYQQPASPLANNVSGVEKGNNNSPKTAEQKEDKQIAIGHQEGTTPATDTEAGNSTNIHSNNQAATVTDKGTSPNISATSPAEKTKGTTLSKPTGVHIQKAPATLHYATTVPAGNQNKGATYSSSSRLLRKPAKRNRSTLNKNNPAIPEQNNNSDINEPDNSNTNVASATTSKPVDVNVNKEAATDSAKSKAVVPPAADSAQTVAQQKKKEDAKKDKIKQPLELGIMVGPDVSAVSFGPLYKAGYNFGLQVGYRFSNRWSINAGVIYTKKFYKADSSHFHYKSPWPGREVYNVEGNCSMWEIPVNVRYDVSFNDKRRWFVSTGLSTYLMDKENYDLYYSPGSTTSYPLNSDSNSSYYFSIWNLSVGMERSLGKRFSLQAEPYLKVPLTGLGKGNMRMDSYGILFTLKYKPFFNVKKSDKK